MPIDKLVTKTSRKSYGRRRTKFTKTVNSVQAAKIAARVAKKTASRQIETKHLPYQNVSDNITNLGFVYLMSDLIQGTTDSDMIGTVCRPTSLWFRYGLKAGDPSNAVRMIFFQDQNQSSITPVVSDVLPNVNLLGTNSMFNPDLVPGRFKIIYDKTHNLDADDPAYSGMVKLRNFPVRKIEFNGNPVSTGSQAKGHIYLLLVSDSGFTTHPTISWDSLLYFKDA